MSSAEVVLYLTTGTPAFNQGTSDQVMYALEISAHHHRVRDTGWEAERGRMIHHV